jgi:plasmid stabilization system protein ParE
MAVTFVGRAQRDLDEAWLYIAEESLTAADNMITTILREAKVLATQPLMGRQRPDLARGLRSWPTSTSYILFYVIKGDDVVVIRVLHHARDMQHITWFH